MTYPTLTTVDQHGMEMGQIAMRLLLDRISKSHADYTPITKVIKPNLVIRESTEVKKG